MRLQRLMKGLALDHLTEVVRANHSSIGLLPTRWIPGSIAISVSATHGRSSSISVDLYPQTLADKLNPVRGEGVKVYSWSETP